MAPQIHTYHCLCTFLLLASTHTLSSLPRRAETLDKATILPLPSTPPEIIYSQEPLKLPPDGYTLLLGLDKDKKFTIIRREDGFEKRFLYRCARCRAVVGYELQKSGAVMDAMEIDGIGSGIGGRGSRGKNEIHVYEGNIVFLLSAGIQSTEFMAAKQHIGEDRVDIAKELADRIAIFE